MTTLDLDQAIEQAVQVGAVAGGRGREMGFLPLITGVQPPGRRRNPPWSDAEDEFLTEMLGRLTETEIGQALAEINGGYVRTTTAVHLRWKRDLGLPAPSKDPDYYTAPQIGLMLGLPDARTVGYWVDRGLLPGEYIAYEPGTKGETRVIRRVRRDVFLAWVVNPANWVYLDIERFDPDSKAGRLTRMRCERQGWRWLSTNQVAALHGVHNKDVIRLIKRGEFPSARQVPNFSGRHNQPRWACWFVRSDDASRPEVMFHRRKGSNQELGDQLRSLGKRWSPKGDAFLALAAGLGLFSTDVAAMLNGQLDSKQAAARVAFLKRNPEKLQRLLEAHDLEMVSYDAERQALHVDWRRVADCFPTVRRAVSAFLGGSPTRKQVRIVAGLLWGCTSWHAASDPTLEPLRRRLQVVGGKGSARMYHQKVLGNYQALVERGLDPLATCPLPRKPRRETGAQVPRSMRQ